MGSTTQRNDLKNYKNVFFNWQPTQLPDFKRGTLSQCRKVVNRIVRMSMLPVDSGILQTTYFWHSVASGQSSNLAIIKSIYSL